MSSMTNFQACSAGAVFVTTLNRATWDIEAKASPRNPYVVSCERSENEESLEVVKRSAKIGRSELYYSKVSLNDERRKKKSTAEETLMPHPLSWICRSFIPPSLIVTRMEVERASKQFSMSSFKAEEGRWMIYRGDLD